MYITGAWMENGNEKFYGCLSESFSLNQRNTALTFIDVQLKVFLSPKQAEALLLICHIDFLCSESLSSEFKTR